MLSAVKRLIAAYRTQPSLLLPTATASYLILGIGFLGFSETWLDLAAAIVGALLAELALTKFTRGSASASRSTLSAAFSIGLFFRATNPLYFALAGVIAILSKYALRLQDRHIFNPSNFAMLALALLLPSRATIEFTQWGHNLYLYGAIFVICFAVAYVTHTFEISLAFLSSYLLLTAVSVLYQPYFFSEHFYGFLGPSLVIFATFMITDPKTAPRARRDRLWYGAAIALTYVLLEIAGIRYALFLSLAAVLLCIAVLDLARTQVAQIPRAPALIACTLSVVLIIAYGGRYHWRLPTHSPLSLSLEYLALGVESRSIFACSSHPLFVADPAAGLSVRGVTLGAAWGDYDGDGSDDLFVSFTDQPSRLYHNNGDGTFSDVTTKVGLPLESSSSAFFADYDNDGWPDLFVVYPRTPDPAPSNPLDTPVSKDEVPALAVYHNEKGRFVNVTNQVGLGSFTTKASNGSLSFADYNNDGWLDFTFVSQGQNAFINYSNLAFAKALTDPFFNTTTEFTCDATRINAVLAAQRAPSDPNERANLASFANASRRCLAIYHALPRAASAEPLTKKTDDVLAVMLLVPGEVHVFENRHGVFTEQPQAAQLIDREIGAPDTMLYEGEAHPGAFSGRFFQPVSFDYNGDGKPDIFISTDFGRSVLLKNVGNFVFQDATAEAGLDYSGTNMGVAVADFAHTGTPGLFATNVLSDALYQNRGGTFVRQPDRIGASGVGWGAAFLDYDLDGFDDLFIANGDSERNAALPIPELARSLFRADAVYRNDGGAFTDVTNETLCADAQSGKALAVSDYDHDGDPDVFVGNIVAGALEGAGNMLYQNETNTPGALNHHYLEVKLRGTASNVMGIGSTVTVTSSTTKEIEEPFIGSSFYSENSQWLTFGLSTSTTPVTVVVHWPSGRTSLLTNVPVDERIIVTEP